MNNRTAGGHSSDIQSHPTDMTMNILYCFKLWLFLVYIFNIKIYYSNHQLYALIPHSILLNGEHSQN
jgi:hypothetical protein